MGITERTVRARWSGGLRAVVDAGGFEVVSDEPVSVPGGTGSGPQPTELLLASIASCFTISLAYSASRRNIELSGLNVEVTGHYNGPAFDAFRITVTTAEPQGEALDKLIEMAKRVCYVTRTLSARPTIDVVTAVPGESITAVPGESVTAASADEG